MFLERGKYKTLKEELPNDQRYLHLDNGFSTIGKWLGKNMGKQ